MTLKDKLTLLKDTAKSAVLARLSPMQKRLLVIADQLPRTCETCSSWSLDAGQQMIAGDPVVNGITGALSPAQASAAQRKTLSMSPEDGQLVTDEAEREVPEMWSDFGACSVYKELTSKRHTKGGGDDKDASPCPRWS